MLKQKTQSIPLTRDEGQCAAAVRGVRKFTKLPTLPCTIRSGLRPVKLFIIGRGNSVSIRASAKVPTQGWAIRGKHNQNFLISMTRLKQERIMGITHETCLLMKTFQKDFNRKVSGTVSQCWAAFNDCWSQMKDHKQEALGCSEVVYLSGEVIIKRGHIQQHCAGGMSARCPFVDSMRTWQCQQRDRAKQNHLLWARGLLDGLGLVPLHPALALSLHHFWLHYVSLTSQLSGRALRVCFSFTFRSPCLAATHAYSQVTLDLCDLFLFSWHFEFLRLLLFWNGLEKPEWRFEGKSVKIKVNVNFSYLWTWFLELIKHVTGAYCTEMYKKAI